MNTNDSVTAYELAMDISADTQALEELARYEDWTYAREQVDKITDGLAQLRPLLDALAMEVAS